MEHSIRGREGQWLGYLILNGCSKGLERVHRIKANIRCSLDLWPLSTLFTSSPFDGRINDQFRVMVVEVLLVTRGSSSTWTNLRSTCAHTAVYHS